MVQSIKAYYDGNAFVPIGPIRANKNQIAIVTLLDETRQNAAEAPWRRFFGALSKESCAEIESALKETERVDTHEW